MKRLHALVVLVLLLLASQPVAPAGAAWLPGEVRNLIIGGEHIKR